MPIRAAVPILLLFLLTTTVSPVQAQDPLPDMITLRGLVTDALSGNAVSGAAVTFGGLDRRAFTDSDGAFSLPDVEPGRHTAIVTQIGYDSLVVELDVRVGAAELFALQLQPDPIVLERIEAMVDRFAAQRNSLGVSVRHFDQELLQGSTAHDALEFIQMRSSMFLTRCPNRLAFGACAYVRGRPMEVQVYVDGARVVGGLEMLATYRPEELYSLEVIGGGRAIRAYTTWYVETVAKGRRVPPVFTF